METPASRGGAGKYVLIAIGVVAVLSLAGFAFWYFAIRSKAPVVPATVVEPVVQPTPAAVMEPEPTSSAATPSDTAAETVVTPITTPPEGTNIPLPDSITTETTTVVEPIPEEDTDQDGLSDRREVELGTDPNKADTDGDGLNDGDEVLKFGTNPLNPDTDGDSFSDGQEIQNSYNPRGPGSCSKTDCSL